MLLVGDNGAIGNADGSVFGIYGCGVFGFYLSRLVLGLVEGQMVRQGWDYLTAKEVLGNWHRLPTAVTASIMGSGPGHMC